MKKLLKEQYVQLCDYDEKNNIYISKQGQEYINALLEIFKGNNHNDIPFKKEEIIKQPELNDFTFKGVKCFQYFCDLNVIPLIYNKDTNKVTNEKIIATNFVNEDMEKLYKKSLGVTYILTCIIDKKEYIIKIGTSSTSMEKRIASYNCGTVSNKSRGTCSTTNFKILQSMVTTRMPLKLYLNILPLEEREIIYEWCGCQSVPFASSKPKAIEDIVVKMFIKQFGFKPLANVQVNATQI